MSTCSPYRWFELGQGYWNISISSYLKYAESLYGAEKNRIPKGYQQVIVYGYISNLCFLKSDEKVEALFLFSFDKVRGGLEIQDFESSPGAARATESSACEKRNIGIIVTIANLEAVLCFLLADEFFKCTLAFREFLGAELAIGMIGGVAIAEMVTVSFRDIGEGIQTDQSLTLRNGEVYPLRKPADIALCITASLQEVSERMLDAEKMIWFERTVEAKKKLEAFRAKERAGTAGTTPRAKEVKGGGSGDRKEKRERQGQGGDNIEVKRERKAPAEKGKGFCAAHLAGSLNLQTPAGVTYACIRGKECRFDHKSARGLTKAQVIECVEAVRDEVLRVAVLTEAESFGHFRK